MIISTISVARSCGGADLSPEHVIIVLLRSAVALLVDIMEVSGKDELLFNDLETYRVVMPVGIGVAI